MVDKIMASENTVGGDGKFKTLTYDSLRQPSTFQMELAEDLTLECARAIDHAMRKIKNKWSGTADSATTDSIRDSWIMLMTTTVAYNLRREFFAHLAEEDLYPEPTIES